MITSLIKIKTSPCLFKFMKEPKMKIIQTKPDMRSVKVKVQGKKKREVKKFYGNFDAIIMTSYKLSTNNFIISP